MKTFQIESIDKEGLQELLNQTIKKASEARTKDFELRLFSIMELKEKTGRSYGFIKGLIAKGILKTTADGKFITAKSIRDYFPDGTI